MKMTTGEYNISVPTGTYTVTASKDSDSQAIIDVEVLEEQTTEVNFQLGGESMETHTEVIAIVGSNMKMVTLVPIVEPTVQVKFMDKGAPIAGKTVELLTENNLSLQSKTTDANGIAIFENVAHGNYKVKIIF